MYWLFAHLQQTLNPKNPPKPLNAMPPSKDRLSAQQTMARCGVLTCPVGNLNFPYEIRHKQQDSSWNCSGCDICGLQCGGSSGCEERLHGDYWVAVKELKLSYYIGETLLFTIYAHYGNPEP